MEHAKPVGHGPLCEGCTKSTWKFCAGHVGLSKDSSMPSLKSSKTKFKTESSDLCEWRTSPWMLSVNRESGSWTNVPRIALAGCLHVIPFSLLFKSLIHPTQIPWSHHLAHTEPGRNHLHPAWDPMRRSRPCHHPDPCGLEGHTRSLSAPRYYNFFASDYQMLL